MTRKPQIVTQKKRRRQGIYESTLNPRPEAALRITVWEDAERGSHHSTECNTVTPVWGATRVGIGNTLITLTYILFRGVLHFPGPLNKGKRFLAVAYRADGLLRGENLQRSLSLNNHLNRIET